jgi:hypothetical protein
MQKRGSLRDLDFASTDRFLKKAFDDPLICNERFEDGWFAFKVDGQSISCLHVSPPASLALTFEHSNARPAITFISV